MAALEEEVASLNKGNKGFFSTIKESFRIFENDDDEDDEESDVDHFSPKPYSGHKLASKLMTDTNVFF